MKKALVLCGGLPQKALIEELKRRGIYTILADQNDHVMAREYADKFYPVSVLDREAVRELAKEEKVDYLITVCADQVLEVVASVAEELGLPWYIDAHTAELVSKKSYMKKVFVENGIPTTKYTVTDAYLPEKFEDLSYPLIVKPTDAYSSRGVTRVESEEELRAALERALSFSREGKAIVEEFAEGDEVSVDVYIEDGVAHVLCLTSLYKIGGDGKFVINRSRVPALVSKSVEKEIEATAQKIADAFGLKNSPMLIQLIVGGERISVVEFCARTGGGVKFAMIKKHSGFDVVSAVVDLTVGEKPHVGEISTPVGITLNEFLYCKPGVLASLTGLPELSKEGVIKDYAVFKNVGASFGEINGSGDRVAYFSIEAKDEEELARLHAMANSGVKALDKDGQDILRHDLLDSFLA